MLLSLVWWYPDEYDFLQIIAEGDSAFASQYLDEEPDSIVQFARYGILREGTKDFAIGALRSFLKANGQSYKKELSPFLRGDMPPELLPDVPDLAELGKFFQKRSTVEVKLRRAVILYLGIKNNWDPARMSAAMVRGLKKRSDRLKPADLFVGRRPQEVMNELYTLDLKDIIGENWETFGPLFDSNKVRFEMNMDTLNRARRIDGHTKPMTEDEGLEFESSYAWLLARLSKLPEMA